MQVERYSAEEFEAIFKFVADAGLWGANVRDVCDDIDMCVYVCLPRICVDV